MDTGSILLHAYNVTDTEKSNAHLPLAPDNPYILDKNSKSPHMNNYLDCILSAIMQ